MDAEAEKKYIEAGKIAASVMNYARKIIKPEMPLLEAVEKIEDKIFELRAKPAFPVDLSCNEIAAHYTPLYDDKSTAEGLLKIDIGVEIDGFPVDTASSIDLSPEQKYKDLINASSEALKNAIKILKVGIKTQEIGKVVEKTIRDYGFNPIRNLYGHELGRFSIHSGLQIPSYDDKSGTTLKEGVFAIEPFATTGIGLVANNSSINEVFQLEEKRQIRDANAREILNFIEKEYKAFPFCTRWLVKKFGTRALFALSLFKKENMLNQYPPLIEKSNGIVSQTEHTIIVTEGKIKVLTETD